MRPASTLAEIDTAVQVLQKRKDTWAGQSIPALIGYLDTLIRDFAAVSTGWVEKVTTAQQIAGNDHAIGTEWMQGPYSILRNLRCLRQSLLEIQSSGRPRIPGRVTRHPNGQVSTQVFPQTFYDRILFNRYRAEVWMDEGVTLENLPQTQAVAYNSVPQAKVSLVLGAGNLAGIPPADVLDRLFIQRSVVALKMNPVNDYLGPVLERGFRCLIE